MLTEGLERDIHVQRDIHETSMRSGESSLSDWRRCSDRLEREIHEDWQSASETSTNTEKVRQIAPAEPRCCLSPKGRTPLIVSIEHGYKDSVRVLIEAKANVNMVDQWENSCRRAWTALDYATHAHGTNSGFFKQVRSF